MSAASAASASSSSGCTTTSDAAPLDGYTVVCQLSELPLNQRKCVSVQGRSVILFRQEAKQAAQQAAQSSPSGAHFGPDGSALYAIDAICQHMGGPLVQGEIEDIVAVASTTSTPSAASVKHQASTGSTKPSLSIHSVVVCPWHRYRFSLQTGEGFYQSMQQQNTKLWTSKGKRQRNHRVKINSATGEISVALNADVDSGFADCDNYNKAKIDNGDNAQAAGAQPRTPVQTHSSAAPLVNGALPMRSGQLLAAQRAQAERHK